MSINENSQLGYEGDLAKDLVINDIVIPKEKITSLYVKVVDRDCMIWGLEGEIGIMHALFFEVNSPGLKEFSKDTFKVSNIELDEFMVEKPQDLVYLQNLKEELKKYCYE